MAATRLTRNKNARRHFARSAGLCVCVCVWERPAECERGTSARLPASSAAALLCWLAADRADWAPGSAEQRKKSLKIWPKSSESPNGERAGAHYAREPRRPGRRFLTSADLTRPGAERAAELWPQLGVGVGARALIELSSI